MRRPDPERYLRSSVSDFGFPAAVGLILVVRTHVLLVVLIILLRLRLRFLGLHVVLQYLGDHGCGKAATMNARLTAFGLVDGGEGILRIVRRNEAAEPGSVATGAPAPFIEAPLRGAGLGGHF